MTFITHYLSLALVYFILSLILEYGYLFYTDFIKTMDYHVPIRTLAFRALVFPYTIAKKIYQSIVK
jgi:hypothetical protein